MHSYILTMVFVKRKKVFIWLYRPSLQATRTPARSSSLHKSRRGVHHCTRAGAEFTTAQEVPDRSAQMHSKHISTYLTMVFVKKEYVFVRLYRPSRQASRTPERSSPLYKKYQIDPLKYIENTFLHPQPWFLSKRNMCSSGYIALHGRLPALRSGVHHCTRSTT